ncbi:hypothetical protein PC9H_001643 [Pleurotus ostreatus]|uniref:Ribonuclease H1 N-terminal domain-containing protein n=1 Tax=Pleurotus ostreatus TaxID=5322 RepID=A0A8H6ZLV0_PLEOS|nr:uncharacterized protein PC9H_011472 [Pleurotus ostreatus]XP_036637138.1 uncharacterized protein PC9H_001643 [Pleurotus ostreatus]KAF7420953.1 hypothetical protein PC9H_011472 [Pleurotus ostreatus]KAF7441294.1 hypothetical protein PC9H_001643 [Pleurotus ostreatus]KAJ8699176.1 hypothetical protein PTI98_002321 [Pleurotus ostreatus]
MAITTDSEISRLAEMVASLAVQVAALTPPANNAGAGANPSPPAPAPTPAPVAVAANSAPPIVPGDGPTMGSSEDQEAEASTCSHRRWYVVIVGLQVGVFRGWTNAAPLVLGVAGSIYNKEPTRGAAIVAFNAAAATGQVRLID